MLLSVYIINLLFNIRILSQTPFLSNYFHRSSYFRHCSKKGESFSRVMGHSRVEVTSSVAEEPFET